MDRICTWLLVVFGLMTLMDKVKAVVYWPPNDDMVKELKGFDLNYTYPWMYSGFVEVEKETDSNLFYWFFREENGNTKAPLVIWINGGPGSSSMLGNLQENGPLKLLKDRESGNVNVHSLKGEAWSAVSNIVFVDQPIGVGYSYGHRKVEDGKQVGEYMVKFIQGFYKKFPDMKENTVKTFVVIPHEMCEILVINFLRWFLLLNSLTNKVCILKKILFYYSYIF